MQGQQKRSSQRALCWSTVHSRKAGSTRQNQMPPLMPRCNSRTAAGATGVLASRRRGASFPVPCQLCEHQLNSQTACLVQGHSGHRGVGGAEWTRLYQSCASHRHLIMHREAAYLELHHLQMLSCMLVHWVAAAAEHVAMAVLASATCSYHLIDITAAQCMLGPPLSASFGRDPACISVARLLGSCLM